LYIDLASLPAAFVLPPTRVRRVRAMAISFSGTRRCTTKSMAACVLAAWFKEAAARSCSAKVRALHAYSNKRGEKGHWQGVAAMSSGCWVAVWSCLAVVRALGDLCDGMGLSPN